MIRLYLVPVESVIIEDITYIGPKYFEWKNDPDPENAIDTGYECIYYGYHPYILLLAKDISQDDHDTLLTYLDVFAFPPLDQLDQAINPVDNIDVFFEGIDLPTDWMTPSTTYREFIKRTICIFLFTQRYRGISEGHDLFENVDLDDTYNDLTSEEQGWFDATVESYGYNPDLILPNMKFRQLLKAASDWMDTRTVYIGGIAF